MDDDLGPSAAYEIPVPYPNNKNLGPSNLPRKASAGSSTPSTAARPPRSVGHTHSSNAKRHILTQGGQPIVEEQPSPPRPASRGPVTNSTYVELSQLKSEVYTLRKDLAIAHIEREKMEIAARSATQVKSDNEALKAQLTELLEERLRMQKECTQINVERSAAQGYLQQQTSETLVLRNSIRALEEHSHTVAVTLTAKEAQVRELESELSSSRQRAKELQNELDTLFHDHANMKAMNRQLMLDLETLQAAKVQQDAVQEELLATIRDQQEARHNAHSAAFAPPAPDVATPLLMQVLEEVRSQRALLEDLRQQKGQTLAPSKQPDNVVEMLAASELARQLLESEVDLLRLQKR